MTITILMENHDDRQGRCLASEHGLALLVDTGRGSFLLDTGASGRFLENARRLGRRIGDVASATVSHGHYDHGGGLRAFLEENPRAPVFVQRGAFEGHFARDGQAACRSIGLEPDLIERRSGRFVLVDDSAELLPGVRAEAAITGSHPLPRDTERFFRVAGTGYQPDDFSHEMMVVAREGRGLVVLSGCSHRGVLNVLETAERRFPGEPIRALIGGFHLVDPAPGREGEPEQEVVRIGRLLHAREGLRVWTGHCTGSRALSLLQRELGDRMTVFSTGQTFEA
jgi:7,8-dihydropterin-6-yl-methyl-4-(beta-D-ribofuranosyl)aminobenzene 5'-phosphate synthase